MQKLHVTGVGMLVSFALVVAPASLCEDDRVDGSSQDDKKTARQVVEPVSATESNLNVLMAVVFQPTFKSLKQQVGIRAEPGESVNFGTVMKDALILAEFSARLHQWSDIKTFATADQKKRFEEMQPELAVEAVRRDAVALYGAAKTKDFDAAKRSFVSMASNCNICHQKMKSSWSPVVLKP